MKVLRDTGATHTLLRAGAVPGLRGREPGEMLMVKGLGGVVEAPLAEIILHMGGSSRRISVGLTEEMHTEGVDVLLGNDVGGGVPVGVWKEPTPEQPAHPRPGEGETKDPPDGTDQGGSAEQTGVIAEAAALTRAMAKKEEVSDGIEGLRNLFCPPSQTLDAPSGRREDPPDGGMETAPGGGDEARAGSRSPAEVTRRVPEGKGDLEGQYESGGILPLTREQMVIAQRMDPEIQELSEQALSEAEAGTERTCLYFDGDLLKRKWRSPGDTCEEHNVVKQIVVPQEYRPEVVRVAHEEVAAHLGAKKTGEAILLYFY